MSAEKLRHYLEKDLNKFKSSAAQLLSDYSHMLTPEDVKDYTYLRDTFVPSALQSLKNLNEDQLKFYTRCIKTSHEQLIVKLRPFFKQQLQAGLQKTRELLETLLKEKLTPEERTYYRDVLTITLPEFQSTLQSSKDRHLEEYLNSNNFLIKQLTEKIQKIEKLKADEAYYTTAQMLAKLSMKPSELKEAQSVVPDIRDPLPLGRVVTLDELRQRHILNQNNMGHSVVLELLNAHVVEFNRTRKVVVTLDDLGQGSILNQRNDSPVVLTLLNAHGGSNRKIR